MMKAIMRRHPARRRPARALPAVAVALAFALAMAAAPATAGAAMAASSAAGAGAAAGAVPEVAPGGVVRWPGEGLESCSSGGESWQPLAGACWYPVDLLAEPGTITVARTAGGGRQTATVRVSDYPYAVQRLTIEDTSKVDLSAADLARVQRENARIGALWSRRTPRRFRPPLAPPLADLPAGGRFGDRRFFNGKPRSPHTGADYAAAAGTPVYAVADGTVALAGDLFFSGNSVFLDHGDGLISMYFHFTDIAVAEGERVTAGQRIGSVGATGRATGPHLHFGLRWRGARVDPAALLGDPAALPEVAGGAE